VKARVDLMLNRWYIDYADPSNFANNLIDGERPLDYGYVPGYSLYDDARYLARLRAAYEVQGEARASTYRDLVADMMRESPPVAVFDTRAQAAQFFSERIDPKCVVTRPQDGGFLDLAALCFRD
jgi:hypothetical protein